MRGFLSKLFSYPAGFIPKSMSAVLPANMLETSGVDKWPLWSPRGAHTNKALVISLLLTKGFSRSPPNVKFLDFTWLAPGERLLLMLDWIEAGSLIQSPEVQFLWWLLVCSQVWHCIKWHRVVSEGECSRGWIRDEKFRSGFSSTCDSLWDWDSVLNSTGHL